MRPLLFLFVSLFVLVPAQTRAAKNVLLLISDNQSWHDVGCYGNDVVQTPHLDRLAKDGVRFESAFATTASCGPSRAVMYTGLLTHANGQYAHPHREHNQEIRPDVTTVFQRLHSRGYRTGLIGKDHIRPREKYPIDFQPRVGSRDVVKMNQAAREFLKQESPKPFLLVVSYHDPHPTSIEGVGWGIDSPHSSYEPVQYDPADIDVPGYLPDTPETRESIAGYYQQISRMDHGVGLVLKSLAESGHDDDTLVMFFSDHGTSQPGAMGSHYEPGVRVPLLVRTPDGPRNFVNQALVTFADLTPTILDWTGTKADSQEFHGRSFLPILSEKTPEDWQSALLSHVAHDIFAYYPMRTLRHPRYKLIWNVTPGAEYPLPIDTWQRRLWAGIRKQNKTHIGPRTVEQFLHRPRLELYDLEEDPWELHNLADKQEYRNLREEMTEELLTRLQATNDPWLRKYHPQPE